MTHGLGYIAAARDWRPRMRGYIMRIRCLVRARSLVHGWPKSKRSRAALALTSEALSLLRREIAAAWILSEAK